MKKTFLKFHAFTLIELLIVVLIIAILAAIAVPNFLEFQTRAKVSRVHSDMRTLAIGMEAYRVDNNEYSPDALWLENGSDPIFNNNRDQWVQFLTTPIAYITKQFDDPFVDKGIGSNTSGVSKPLETGYTQRAFEYPAGSASDRQAVLAEGHYWAIRSQGPNFQADPPAILSMLINNDTSSLYDPTNGTISVGDIWRTNKGILNEGGKLD